MNAHGSHDRMVMTVLEAHVAPEQWPTLEAGYQGAVEGLPPQLVRTYLVQSADDPTLWRVISLWHSRKALDEFRQSVETPGGVLIFRSAGAEPTLSIFEVAYQAAQ